jgi:hypothetical protein
MDHTEATTRYRRPGAFTRRVFNPVVARLARWGISVKGTRILEVRGRTSGEPRSTVVNLRNIRAAGGEATLRLGRRVTPVRATELDDAAKVPVLRAYLEAWGWEVGKLVEGLRAGSDDDEISAAAPGFPVFVLQPR